MSLKGIETSPKMDAKKSQKVSVSNQNLTIKDLMDSSVLPVLIRCIKENDHTTLQFKAACKVTNLVCDNLHQNIEVITMRLFLQLLSSFYLDNHEEDVLALVDFICSSHYLMDYIIKKHCVHRILALIKVDRPTSWLFIVVRFLSNFCYYIYITAHPTIRENWIFLRCLQWKVVSIFVPLLGHTDAKIQKEVLTAFIQIAQCSGAEIGCVFDLKVLQYFPALLSHSNEEICTVAFQFLLMIPSSSHSMRQSIVDSKLLPKIFENLRKNESKAQILATQVIANFVKSNDAWLISALISNGVISHLCDLLASNEVEVVKSALLSLKDILKTEGVNVQLVIDMIRECNGVEKIKNLQDHQNGEIFNAANIIDLINFPGDEDGNIEVLTLTFRWVRQFFNALGRCIKLIQRAYRKFK